MVTPILHHYDMSPYAEKIRLIMGRKGLVWRSVQIPMIMPKPDLIALTGGYRRTPVLQLGADIYCDTATIARALDRLAPSPPLAIPHTAATAEALSMLGARIFMSGVVVFLGAGDVFPQDFLDDRQSMFPGGFNVSQAKAAAPSKRDQIRALLAELEDQLESGHRFLLGDEVSYADFSVYHPLWFLDAHPLTASLPSEFPHLLAWRERMAGFGHGVRTEMSSEEAIEIARTSTPTTAASEDPNDPNGRKPGDRVRVMPEDYGLDPVEGELVCSDPWEIAIRRIDERAGEVVVHFPREGYLTFSAG